MAYDTPESLTRAYIALHNVPKRRCRWDETPANEARLDAEKKPMVYNGPLFKWPTRKRKRTPSPDRGHLQSEHLQSYEQVSSKEFIPPHAYLDDNGDFTGGNDYADNPMADFDARTLYVQEQLDQDNVELQACRGEMPLHFQYVRTAAELDTDDLEACFKLIEATSGDDYKASSMGWKPKKKKEEMKDKEMQYLLVKEGDSAAGKLLGFISFMFTVDDPPHALDEVVYIYEVHLDEGLRGRGLGSRLIRFVEVACCRCGFLKAMLTVFKSNAAARKLYEKLGYSKDQCSPEDRVVRGRTIEADYLIMSKKTLE
jgi:ribosomal protein S18 acetylase RimI-like enzyme